MKRRASASSGFSLLEVMVSIAILAMSLVVLIGITTNAVRATNHAKMTTAATFLARTRIADMEDQVLAMGFGDISEEDEGTFIDQGYPEFRWHTVIERVELPTDIAANTQNQATSMTQTNNPLQAMAGMVGGMMSTLIEPIRIGLQESVRRVTVNVTWREVGRPLQSLDVVLFMTDPARLDLAMQAPAAATAQGNQPGSPTSTTTPGGQQAGQLGRSGTSPTTQPATGMK